MVPNSPTDYFECERLLVFDRLCISPGDCKTSISEGITTVTVAATAQHEVGRRSHTQHCAWFFTISRSTLAVLLQLIATREWRCCVRRITKNKRTCSGLVTYSKHSSTRRRWPKECSKTTRPNLSAYSRFDPQVTRALSLQ
jgi:hypothetical protein